MLENHVRTDGAFETSQEDLKASESLDALMSFVTEMLPVNRQQYPDVSTSDQSDAVSFCLRHSALHFTKTAGQLASFVEDADHGRYAKIQTLEQIVAASLVNSLKLADEIGITGAEIMEAVKAKFRSRVSTESRT